MKALSFLFVVLATPITAQAPSTDSISLGLARNNVILSLGASEDLTLRVLREHFHVGETATKGEYEISSDDRGCPLSDCYGYVTFKQGKVSSVVRNWDIVGPDEAVGVVQSIRGAMSSIGTSRTCSVKAFDLQEPHVERSGVVVSCEKRAVQIMTSRATFGDHTAERVVVWEMLSSAP